jgi:hypothetical protein
MCDNTDGPETFPTNLAVSGNATLSADVGSHSLHLYMIMVNNRENNKIEKEISMHLSLEEVEELIKGLKRKLKLCYEAKVERL